MERTIYVSSVLFQKLKFLAFVATWEYLLFYVITVLHLLAGVMNVTIEPITRDTIFKMFSEN